MKCERCGKESTSAIWVKDEYICDECIKKDFEETFIKPAEKIEMVNHPKHYGGDTTYECIKVLEAWLGEEQYKGFLRGNAIKYLCRTGKKDETVQELNKSKWYIEKLIEKESK